MLRRVIVAICACAIVASAVSPLAAQVSVNIGINVPTPPQLVVVPSTPVQYAPNLDNYFFYGGEYFVFVNDQWYVSPGFNGPWAILAPEFVPLPLLQVPVRFYRRPPPAWRSARHEGPPPWAPAWGHRWEERRHEGQAQPRLERREERRPEGREERRERR